MKINYGIYIGTSSASIAKMDAGEVCVLKSDTLNDEIPLCVAINKKGNILAGKKAVAIYRSEVECHLLNSNNSFIEFSRTLGTDKKYYSSNANHSFSSEELVAEIIKCLISFEKNIKVEAAVITIPDGFYLNQIEAIRKSASLAGLNQVEFIQESVATGLAYNFDSIKNQGFNLIFQFDVELKVSLLKGNSILDTESDNYLGGKNLDLAIVDEIIIPHIQKSFSIDGILDDDIKKSKYREALKYFAEELKKELAFRDEFNLYKEEGCGTDDDGEEIEIDITVTQEDLEKVLSPLFQKAIDISKKVLERNNLKPSTLNKLVLVGREAYSPILGNILEKQICKPETTIDSETVIVKGAALYASTIDVLKEIKEKTKDKSKIQIEIGYKDSTIGLEEFVTLKILTDKTERRIPEKVFAEITRTDRAWSSGKIEINELGEVIEVPLIEKKKCIFEVCLYDKYGNKLDCEPSAFQIVQGKISKSATLPYNIGIEVQDKRTGKIVFRTISGLEKNKSLPASGTYNGIKTDKPFRPGMDSDFIKIPIYEGEHGADRTRAIYNVHIFDIIISGADLPALLPENSDVDLTVNVDRSEQITVTAYFPYLDFSYEANVERTISKTSTSWLSNEIRKAKGSIIKLKDEGVNNEQVQKAETEIVELERKFENNKNDVDSKQEVLTHLRKTLKAIDELQEIRLCQNENLNITLKQVEDLLFDLGSNSKITSEKFSEVYDLLQTKLTQDEINILYNDFKSYE